jgi:peptide/nickel transport system substrate-binding protein
MEITRRQAGTLAMGTLLAATGPARVRAEGSNTLVSGDNLPANLDPHQIFDVPMQGYAVNTYDTLYRYEGNPPEMKPWLAESHTASADGLTWDFRLRQGAKFHDGSAITADDVVYSFRRVLGLGKAPAGAFLPVLKAADVTAPDKSTVRFRLGQPYAPFLAAIPIVCIVNPRAIAGHEKDNDWGAAWLASNEAGSGAYELDPTSYVPLERVEIKRFAGHFMGWQDNPHPVEAVAYRPTKETSTRILALLKGSIDWTDSYLPTDQVEQVNASANAYVEKNVSMRTFIIRMNNMKPPLDNINMRLGFAHAFNYPGFIDDILKGYAQRDATPMPNTLWGFPGDAKGYEFDLKKAKAYFDKARAEGAPVQRPVGIHIQQQLEQTTQAAQLFQSDLATIGINLKIVNDTWANITTNTAKAETTPDMWIHWVSTYFVDPENWIGQMYDSQFFGTWKASSWYKNAKVDALLREARTTIGQDKRAPLYEEATRLIMADSPDIWVYNTVELRGVAKRVQNFRFCPVGSGTEVRWVSLRGAV